jgi:hypothetical protein
MAARFGIRAQKLADIRHRAEGLPTLVMTAHQTTRAAPMFGLMLAPEVVPFRNQIRNQIFPPRPQTR